MEEQTEKQDENGRLFVTFTAEEIGKIVVSIIKGVERRAAIRAKEAIDWAWKNT